MTSLMTPDNFKRDWIGWAGNQGFHLIMGASAYLALHVAYLETFGTLAYRWPVAAICLSGYLIWEGAINKWAGWDSVEDTVFFAFYGAGIPAWCLPAIDGDSIELLYSLREVARAAALVWFHFVVGVLIRWEHERAT